jgi:hypothetical protein
MCGVDKMKKIFTLFLMFMFVASFVAAAELSTKATEENLIPDKPLFRLMSVQQDDINHCYAADESYAVYHNGLWWAWLAPVAQENWDGMGITPDASLIGDGWRNVAGEDEWALRPDASLFGQTKCAAEYFFTPAPFCDWDDPYYVSSEYPNGAVTWYITGNVAEFWVVHDDCGSNNIPEFGVVAAGVAMIGALGIFLFKRK